MNRLIRRNQTCRWREAIEANPAAAHARLPREYLAESVVNFERYIAHGQYKKGYVTADGTSRMGDYNELLTVRDLSDLVEFLRAIR